MLYLIGLGLGGCQDLTLRGLEVLKKCHKVFFEAYTSVMESPLSDLETLIGKEIISADREMVEEKADEILADAKENNVAFLVVGDPLGATTHSDLILRALESGVSYEIIHNASIMNAVGCCGLQLYNFGETVSLCFWTETSKPDSYFDRILSNLQRGLHTLCLLDIKLNELNIDAMMRGKKVRDPPRSMSSSEAAQQLLNIIDNRSLSYKSQPPSSSSNISLFPKEKLCVALARIGWSSQKIICGTLNDLSKIDMGDPIHCLVVCGKLHPLEIDFLRHFAPDKIAFDKLIKS